MLVLREYCTVSWLSWACWISLEPGLWWSTLSWGPCLWHCTRSCNTGSTLSWGMIIMGRLASGGDEPDPLNISILRHVNGTDHSQRWFENWDLKNPYWFKRVKHINIYVMKSHQIMSNINWDFHNLFQFFYLVDTTSTLGQDWLKSCQRTAI